MMILSNRTAIAILTLMLAGCTQQQQSEISSSDWQRKLNRSLKDVTKTAETKVDHTGNWLRTETDINKLQASIRNNAKNNYVTANQEASLRNSLDYIRRLQERSIQSANGIDDSERAQIAAAVDRVEKRLNQWLSARPDSTM